MTIIPSLYWGDIEYFANIIQGGSSCVIDPHEHYVKRSMRNRTTIMTAQGIMPLSVHIKQANRPRQPMRDILIDYSEPWQHVHRTAIVSAYHASPYYDLMEDHFSGFYTRQWKFLVDLNFEILDRILDLIHVSKTFSVSEHYVIPSECDRDLRNKKRETTFVAPRYFQLFSDRIPFAQNISILDMLMSLGPSSADVLLHCRL